MHNPESKILALNEYHTSKKRMSRLSEISNISERLFNYIESLNAFAYPSPAPKTRTEHILERMNSLSVQGYQKSTPVDE